MNDNKIQRNVPCPCESGLKYKHCHGDPVKVQACQHIAMKLMERLIVREQMQKGLISFPWQCDSCNKGFVKPVKGTIRPDMPMCPECNSTNVRRNEDVESTEKNDEATESGPRLHQG